MARVFRNYTDLPTDRVKAIYEAVCPPGLRAHDVNIKNHGRGGGRGVAYHEGSEYHPTRRPFVNVCVPKTDAESRYTRPGDRGGGGYLPVTHGSRWEVLVYILAHELRHLWQAKAKGKPRGMVHGARGRFSERDASAYGLQMLRRYRRGELVPLPKATGLPAPVRVVKPALPFVTPAAKEKRLQTLDSKREREAAKLEKRIAARKRRLKLLATLQKKDERRLRTLKKRIEATQQPAAA